MDLVLWLLLISVLSFLGFRFGQWLSGLKIKGKYWYHY